jgi:hypothetical protein
MLSLAGNNNSKLLDDILRQIEKILIQPEFSNAINPDDEKNWKNFDVIRSYVNKYASNEAYKAKITKLLRIYKEE